jgi:transposase-like protein
MFDMAYPAYLKLKARQLRQERGLTIDELAERLALSRTTIYYWVRDIPIPRRSGTGWPASARRKGSAAMQAKHLNLRRGAYEQGRREFDGLSACPTFRDFLNLYMAEGYKRSRNVVSIANSDPAIVRVAHPWIRRFARNPVTYAIQHHADQDPEYLKRFWAFGLDADIRSMRYQRKSNSNHLTGRTWRSKWGVLTVTANDTLFRMRLEAWMNCLKEVWLDSAA